MDPATIGATITGVSQLVGTGANAFAAGKMNKRLRRWNVAQATKAYERQQEQITQQNLYNSPLKQMERFKEAGLNPNLMYGQASNSNQQGIADYNAAAGQYDLPEFDLSAAPAIQTYQNVATQNQQRKNMVAEEKLTNSRILESIANLPGIRARSDLDVYSTDFKKLQMHAQRPYIQKSAALQYEQNVAKLMGQRIGNTGGTLRNVEKEQYLAGGGVYKQLQAMDFQNDIKQKQLFQYSLDAAIKEQQIKSTEYDLYWKEKLKGLSPADVGRLGLTALGAAIPIGKGLSWVAKGIKSGATAFKSWRAARAASAGAAALKKANQINFY